ncbi:hypothetical protein LTS12_027010 [Elasticomyces elasticus]|nr:hypothetical protein LTS12_027010 [Elasticomyces elasticus]
MTLAVRGVVELFRLAKREKEVDREILAFSISHDHSTVRIYGHYPVIQGENTAYYRHPIRKFDFTEQDGKEKWTAYRFTKNVYDVWTTMHFARICSVIDELPPDIAFEVSERAGSRVSEATGLSRQRSRQPRWSTRCHAKYIALPWDRARHVQEVKEKANCDITPSEEKGGIHTTSLNKRTDSQSHLITLLYLVDL